jgi:transketolase N-terminal domain/subunit
MMESGSKRIRRIILEQSKWADVGHIGPALSVVDVIAALYGVLTPVWRRDLRPVAVCPAVTSLKGDRGNAGKTVC